MKTIKAFTLSLFFSISLSTSFAAPEVNVDEIIATYHENIGGKKALSELKGVRLIGSFQQGQMKFPMEVVQLASGKQYSKFVVQGKEFKQGVFDGETLWGMNFMTMKAEKAESEATENMKLQANDFPDPFLNYKEKGYTVELIGTEIIDGAETYKVKLTQEPIKVEGKEVPNVSYFYFDVEAMVPLLMETEIKQGPAKGMIQQVKMSDYQEVGGIYFPFTLITGVKGQGEAPMNVEKIELNPTVDDAEFAFPKHQ
jgi:outer membrane lipoprotein-sorting protein